MLSLIFIHKSLFLNPSPVFAHVLQTDGNIGAVLHIEPDDDPIVGQPAQLLFDMRDKTGRFQGQSCDCEVVITEAGKQIYSQTLYAQTPNPALNNPVLTFTFPQKDVYQIQVVGKPTKNHVFQPFTLSYSIRVDREVGKFVQLNNYGATAASQDWFPTHWIHLIGVGMVGLFLVFALIKQLTKPKNL